MRLSEYIERVWGGSVNAFAKASGIAQTTLSGVARGAHQPSIPTARAIERASRAHPAPDGAFVTIADLAAADDVEVAS